MITRDATVAITFEELARRTGAPLKALRRYEDMGLIYTRGRSPVGQWLYDGDAVRCVQIIRALSMLGLTETEIQQLAACSAEGGKLVGPELGAMLRRVQDRTRTRIKELEQLSQRVQDFERRHYVAKERMAG